MVLKLSLADRMLPLVLNSTTACTRLMAAIFPS
jgi:hypothetical protein